MTFIQGMSKSDGIYMSADYRVTDARTGTVLDDASIKFLTIYYRPDKTGPKALLAYSGLAQLPDGTPTGTWIRETLRGENEVIDQSMRHLLDRLNRDVAQLKVHLIIDVLVIEPGRRLHGQISNLRPRGQAGNQPEQVAGSFGYVMQERHEPFWFANGSGAAVALADREHERINTQLAVWPRRPLDHMKLLASVNRRVAAKEPTVSPWCRVSFIPTNGEGSLDHDFAEGREKVPFSMPFLLFGLDLTDTTARFMEDAKALRAGQEPTPVDTDTINKGLKRRP